MALFVDYHMHPNLSFIKFLADRKAKRWWRAFAKHKLDAVICAEHAYKNPKRAYEVMIKNRPKNSKTLLIPGVETLSREGVDTVVFSQSPKIYEHKYLVGSNKFTVSEIIKYAKKHKLYAFVTHPYTPGFTGVANIKGERFGKKAVRDLEALEIHNAGFEKAMIAMQYTGLRFFFPDKYNKMEKTQTIPKVLYSNLKLKFKAAGSDAHDTIQMGSGYKIPFSGAKTEERVFKAVVSNTKGKFVSNQHWSSLLYLPISGLGKISEWFIKHTVF